MKVEVEVPDEFQSTCIGLLNQRKGQMQNSETRDGTTTIEAHVPLSSMFGFSTALRSGTQVRVGGGLSAESRCWAPEVTPAWGVCVCVCVCVVQGKGEFTMEYKEHSPVPRDLADKLCKQYQESQQQGR